MQTTLRRNATKTELVRLRHEIKVAREGLELLERRRDSLMAEGINLLKRAKQQRLQLTPRWQTLLTDWNRCQQQQNLLTLGRLAVALPTLAPLNGGTHRWMSVDLASFSCDRPVLEMAGGVAEVDLSTEAVRGELADLLPELVGLMNNETNIRRISIALKQCHRQVNALNEVVIPGLQQEKVRVEQRLEEKEREAIFQVKLLKARGQ